MSTPEIITLEPGQYGQWDAFVERSPQGDVFCYSWWLEAITKSHFRILVILEEGKIVAGIPLTFDEEGRINQPPVTRTTGVLFEQQGYLNEQKRNSNQRKWLNALLDHLPLDNFVQMNMHHNFTDWLPFKWRGFNQTTRYTYIIHYHDRTIQDLWNILNGGRKETIKKAEKNGIKVTKSEDLNLLYDLEMQSFKRQGLKFRIPFNDIKILDEAISKNGNRIIFQAIDNSGLTHAMLYVTFSARSAYALISGGDLKFRNIGGHTLVMWEAVKYFCGKVEYFNFGGSDIEPIESHLRGFGGELTPYFRIFNEKLISDKSGIRYHLAETGFHLNEVFKAFKNRIFRRITGNH